MTSSSESRIKSAELQTNHYFSAILSLINDNVK